MILKQADLFSSLFVGSTNVYDLSNCFMLIPVRLLLYPHEFSIGLPLSFIDKLIDPYPVEFPFNIIELSLRAIRDLILTYLLYPMGLLF